MITTKRKKQVLNKVYFIAALFILLASCNRSIKPINSDFFEFFVDKKMEIENFKYSGYSGIYILNRKDTAYYNFGYRISTLAEIPPDLIYMESMENLLPDTTGEKFFTTNRNFDKDRLRKQNVFFYREENQIWKYTIPVDTVNAGIVGLFIDSLRLDKTGVLKFNFFIKNIHSISYAQAIRIMHSISMHNSSIANHDFRSTLIVE